MFRDSENRKFVFQFTFKLQVYINGHNILANELNKNGIGYSMIDNAFDHIDDFKILRIETTTNDVSFFKHYREVEHRGGNKSMKYAPLIPALNY